MPGASLRLFPVYGLQEQREMGRVGVGLGSLRWMFSPGDKSEALEKGKNMD